LPNCVYLLIAETAMLNTYPQKSLERRVFLTDRFAKSHQKNANPPLLLWPSTRIFKADEAVKQHPPSKPPGCTADQLPCSADISHPVRARKTGFSKQRINST